MKEGVSWNSVVVLRGARTLVSAKKESEVCDYELSGRSVIYVYAGFNEDGGKGGEGEKMRSGNGYFCVTGKAQDAEDKLKSILNDLGVTAPLYCLADSFWVNYFLNAFSPGKFALNSWDHSLGGSDEILGVREFERVEQGVETYAEDQFPASTISRELFLSEIAPLRILMLISPHTLYINTISDYCESFDLFSRHHFTYASASRGSGITGGEKAELNYSNYEVVMIHYSVRVAFWEEVIDKCVIDAIQDFSGYKILFIQDEYDRTAIVRERINVLGIDKVYTCVPHPFIDRVYPKAQFPGVEFCNILTGYLPPYLENNQNIIPLNERQYGVVYRGRSLAYAYGELGQEKSMIGKMVKDACERKGIPEDIEWTEDKRIYRADWNRFLQSGRATLGTESGSNVFDMDGSIQEGLKEALLDKPDLSYEEAREMFFLEDNIGVEMNQISPKIFEFIASKTALILYEGDYSGILQPNVHYLSLKKDGSNLNEVLRTLDDLPKLEEMIERAYSDIVTDGIYSYRNFVRTIDQDLDEKVASIRNSDVGRQSEGISFSTPPKYRKLSQLATEAVQERKTVIHRHHRSLSLTKEIAHLKSKMGNFHGMVERRKQKIAKLSEKLGKKRRIG